jgi:PAS domain S-box-containing protein
VPLSEEDSVLLDVIERARDAILADWQERARAELASGRLPRPSLRDHMPEVVVDVAELLRGDDMARAEGVERHGRDRLSRGFDIALVLREYDLLRDCILDHWLRAVPEPRLPAPTLRRLLALFGRLAAQAVRVAERAREAARARLARAIGLANGDLDRLAQAALVLVDGLDRVDFHCIGDDGEALIAEAATAGAPTADAGLAVEAARTGHAVSVRDPSGAGVRLALPLSSVDGGRHVAVFASSTIDDFTVDERMFFDALAAHASAHLSQTHLLDEQRRALAALNATHAELDALYSNAPEGIAHLDRDLRYVRVNSALAGYNGRPAEDHIGRSIADFVPPEVLHLVDRLREVACGERAEFHTDLVANVPSWPQPRHWEVTAYPVSVEDQQHGVGVFVRDVTAERQAREALRVDARQQAELAAFGLRALQAVDEDAVLADAIDTVARALEVECVKTLQLQPDGSTLLLRSGVGWHPGVVGSVLLRNGAGSQADFTLRTRTPVIVENLAAETRFDTPLLREHGIISGISTVVEAQEAGGRPWGVLGAHARSPRRFRTEDANFLQSIANLLGACLLRVRADQRARAEAQRATTQQFLADATASILATTLDYEETVTRIAELCTHWFADCCMIELVGENDHARRLRVVHRDRALAGVTARLQRLGTTCKTLLATPVIDTGQPFLVSELSELTPREACDDDEQRALIEALAPRSLLALPLRSHGRLLGGLVLLSAQAGRFSVNDVELAATVAERAATAVQSALLHARAQHALRERDEVLSVVAHDIRDPLHTIGLVAHTLPELLDEPARSRLLRSVDLIVRATERANRLIADLLDLQRFQAGHLLLKRQAFDPAALVEEVVELFAPAAHAAKIELAGQSPRFDVIDADRDRLLQVLSNLVGNAIKFTPSGGHVMVGVNARDEHVEFFVRDDGPGISAADQARIFDRFWQVRGADRRGAGLGLSIARGIVEAHGGTIRVDSVEGGGSCFSFVVPRVSTTGAEDQAGTEPASPPV